MRASLPVPPSNAALGRRLAETSTQGKLLAGVAEAFGLNGTPQRIEVYDNSHILGTAAVGGMIVAGPEGSVARGRRYAFSFSYDRLRSLRGRSCFLRLWCNGNTSVYHTDLAGSSPVKRFVGV